MLLRFLLAAPPVCDTIQQMRCLFRSDGAAAVAATQKALAEVEALARGADAAAADQEGLEQEEDWCCDECKQGSMTFGTRYGTNYVTM